MKKMYLNLLTTLTLSLVSSQVYAAIILKNNYSGTIEFVTAGDNATEIVKNNPKAAMPLSSGKFTVLSSARFNFQLSIRSIGGTFENISYIFNQIDNDIARHPNRHADEDVVISINSSNPMTTWNPLHGYYWNVRLNWVPHNSMFK